MLELRRVSKRFVGVVATDDVSLEVKSGEVHALIGPNGAGKTTLISQISGSLPSDRGEIRFDGQDITRARPYERVKLGLARSYQITSIFKRFTVLDNLALAVQARSGSSFSFWRPVSRETALTDEARSIAGEVGLQEKQSALAATLAHGEQRAGEAGDRAGDDEAGELVAEHREADRRGARLVLADGNHDPAEARAHQPVQ